MKNMSIDDDDTSKITMGKAKEYLTCVIDKR